MNYFVKSINKGVKKGIAITFDDGPDPKITPQILDILAHEKVKATFFVIGHKIKGQDALLQRIYKEGHIIGNHSFAHNKRLTILSSNNLKKDISNCSAVIEKVIHQKIFFFRPPFGVTNPRYSRALKHLNIKSIGWSARSFDTIASDKAALYKKIIKKIKKGSIVLLHDTQKITLDILPDLMQFCKNNGINIVSLPELIEEKAYK